MLTATLSERVLKLSGGDPQQQGRNEDMPIKLSERVRKASNGGGSQSGNQLKEEDSSDAS